ncbi:MAG: adenylate/guanylate cyclase domain-containing protein, partial [Halobacteriovoraceae bacterium]|nr:adenylate/guanylate cyclase domain-containing protein [Halobacteriovoraceae bacterium]
MISKIIQYFGTFLIIAFCSISIFFSLAEREIDDPSIRKFLSYPSFFEDRFYDYRMKSTLDPNKVDKRLVLVAIDDNSLRKLGKWPVPRIYWVKLMKKLQTFGAKVIAYDVFFSEMSNSCDAIPPEKLMAETIKDIQKDPKRHVILPYSLDTQNAEYFKEIPDTLYNFLMDTKQGENLNLDAKKVSKAVFPISILADTEAGLAHIEAEGDSDGIFRHYQVLGNVDTLYFPSFSLMAYQYYTGDKPVLEVLSIGDATLKLKTGDLKLNYKGESKVRWLGDQANFPFVSMYDVLMAEDDDAKMIKLLKDNIIFIGSTSFGAHDLRHTPVNAMLPGIYFHMNMVNMLLDGKFYVPQSDSTQISWALLFGGTLVMLLIMIFGNALLDVFTMMSLVTGLYLFDTYYLLPGGYEIKLFFCLMSVVACYSWNTFIHFYFASKDKKFLKEAFSTYISPELIDEMYDAGEPPKLGGDCGVRTAFFTDIQGFSTFSEKLSATQLVELLNEYLTAMTDILLEEMGTLDKYEGDAIIAFFGAPMPLEDHATRAVSVA